MRKGVPRGTPFSPQRLPGYFFFGAFAVTNVA